MNELFITGRWYHYARLPEHEKKMYMQILDGLKARKTDFSFPTEKHGGVYPPRDRVLDLILQVLWDNPALYYVDATNIRLHVQTFPTGRARVEYTEYYPAALQPHVEQVLRMRVDEILNLLRDQAEGHSQLYRLLRYMAENLRYMYGVEKVDALKNLEARTVVGPLLNHLGVCAGNTKMFKLICDQLGIGCFYIHGQALTEQGWANHGWNVVYLDGAFYHVDVTFDCEQTRANRRLSCKYFLVGDAAMEADHRWDRSAFPAMPENYL